MTDKTTKWMIYESIKIILLGIIAACAIYLTYSEHKKNNPPIVEKMEFAD
ncbi:hypothetical protein [Neisseria elongata]|jgi:hypothetical protein|nr:hypothetical protein [Neisseria elongata]MBM7065356.1 hypothetical protein [Neisseria elongata]